MRLLRYVLLELALLLGAFTVSGVLLGQGCTHLARRSEARTRANLAASFPAREPLFVAPPPNTTNETGGTFLGMADDLLLARLRTAAITRSKANRGGSSLSFRLDFADGSRAAFKPAQTNLQTIPRKEVAAYRICRLLGLSAVPPATLRAVSRDELFTNLHPESQPLLPRLRAETLFTPQNKTLGALSYWIPEIKDAGWDTPEATQRTSRWLQIGVPLAKEDEAAASQLSNLVVFDFLTANPDRYSGGNIKTSPDGERVYFMDNTMAFFLQPEGHGRNRAWLQRTERFSRTLVSALPRLTINRLERILGPDAEGQEILTTSEIRAVVARREALQRHVADLVTAHGEANVLIFP
ncbi:MAG TPA: hypothetical protein VGF45_13130 [Polyangia bacterium]